MRKNWELHVRMRKVQCGISAFTRRELLAVIGMLCLLLVVLNAIVNSRARAQRINCTKNLQQLGLAFKTWALDRQDIFPMSLSTNQGGTKEYLEQGEVFRHFQVLSNELANPKCLFAPPTSGSRSRISTADCPTQT